MCSNTFVKHKTNDNSPVYFVKTIRVEIRIVKPY